MKTKKIVVGFLMFSTLLGVSIDANAWFFFFIPGSAVRKVGDALTGSEGENCVASTTKVGDTLTSFAGNTATIVSLSGTSSICRDEKLPIRAKLDFHYTFSSKAGIELPDTFTNKELTATQRFNGTILRAIDDNRRLGVTVTARPRKANTSGGEYAKNIGDIMMKTIEDGKLSSPEELTINGLHAYRFQAEGKNKGMFGRSFTYVVTVLESNEEYVVVNTNCLTSDFDNYHAELLKYAFDVRGLDSADGATVAATPPANSQVGQIDTNPVSQTSTQASAQTPAPMPAQAANDQQRATVDSPGTK